ncbi:MAG TPA: L-threonylcarbamoyladenylate synthase, partial [Rhodospirillales bacterium]|nr:L-threonylcarbamoyladenylate synthase [Rhodospirillales bacterium]
MSAPLRAATAAAVAEAAALIRQGALVAFPTETVYGLGADAGDSDAVAAVFAVKDRPTFNPLIVHVAGLASAEPLVALDERALRLAAACLPGPLTLVLPRRPEAPLTLLVGAGLNTVAVRVPGHPVAQALLEACRRPVAAPS